MRRLAIFAVTIATIISIAAPSLASFGFELSESSGRTGDQIEVTGAGLLTCCPANTPTEASLVLWVDPARPSSEVVLFAGVPADASGGFTTSFDLPPLPAGEYELRYCSTAPDGTRTCVPGETMTIFEPVSDLWPILAGTLLAVILLLVLWHQRRRRQLDAQTIRATQTLAGEAGQDDHIETLSGRPVS